MANSLEDLTPGCRNETIANASNVHQIFPLVNTNDERVESVRTRNVSPENNFYVVKVFISETDAEKEVARLNEVNADKSVAPRRRNT